MPNVFQLWRENGMRVPFRVRRVNWHPQTYTVVWKTAGYMQK